MTAHTAAARVPAPPVGLPTPSLLVDVPRMQANIDALAERQRRAGIALRPHVKTSKCLQVARRQLAAGATGMTCSTPAEVTALTEAGVGGLLWAHLPVGPDKVRFAVEAAVRHRVLLMVDSWAVAEPLAVAARSGGAEVAVLIEVDSGHHRTGVAPADALPLARALQGLRGVSPVGVLTHEGQLAGHGPDRAGLEAAGRAAAAALAGVAARFRAAGLDCAVVSVGSTPGITSAAAAQGVTEARPGTYVFFDANQLRLGSCRPGDCALSVLTTVVSRPGPGRAVIDAGLKAMSSDTLTEATGAGLVADLALVPRPDLRFVTANEEHGWLVGPGVDALRVGDRLRVIPNHACGTVNMWSQLYALSPDGAVECWPVVARH